ncbi:MAG TPA: hypothetical protein VGT04_12000 [Acidobacteriaceae bacterium]|nr:hypothetical protein [Acidobacteriaceae bacterium]
MKAFLRRVVHPATATAASWLPWMRDVLTSYTNRCLHHVWCIA